MLFDFDLLFHRPTKISALTIFILSLFNSGSLSWCPLSSLCHWLIEVLYLNCLTVQQGSTIFILFLSKGPLSSFSRSLIVQRGTRSTLISSLSQAFQNCSATLLHPGIIDFIKEIGFYLRISSASFSFFIYRTLHCFYYCFFKWCHLLGFQAVGLVTNFYVSVQFAFYLL